MQHPCLAYPAFFAKSGEEGVALDREDSRKKIAREERKKKKRGRKGIGWKRGEVPRAEQKMKNSQRPLCWWWAGGRQAGRRSRCWQVTLTQRPLTLSIYLLFLGRTRIWHLNQHLTGISHELRWICLSSFFFSVLLLTPRSVRNTGTTSPGTSVNSDPPQTVHRWFPWKCCCSFLPFKSTPLKQINEMDAQWNPVVGC